MVEKSTYGRTRGGERGSEIDLNMTLIIDLKFEIFRKFNTSN